MKITMAVRQTITIFQTVSKFTSNVFSLRDKQYKNTTTITIQYWIFIIAVLTMEFVHLINKWNGQDNGAFVLTSLEYLDVATLIKKKPVCKHWQQLCTQAIDSKCDDGKKAFQSKEELKQAVDKYSPGRYRGNRECTPTGAEEIASKYGYPIGKWDVSNVEDFSCIFLDKGTFNEPIGSWDVSNATTMVEMFDGAINFNQDISSWDVSNVTSMNRMFHAAMSFNHDISSWDVSNVTNMSYMFFGARSFNQDISTWDVSKKQSTASGKPKYAR